MIKDRRFQACTAHAAKDWVFFRYWFVDNVDSALKVCYQRLNPAILQRKQINFKKPIPLSGMSIFCYGFVICVYCTLLGRQFPYLIDNNMAQNVAYQTYLIKLYNPFPGDPVPGSVNKSTFAWHAGVRKQHGYSQNRHGYRVEQHGRLFVFIFVNQLAHGRKQASALRFLFTHPLL